MSKSKKPEQDNHQPSGLSKSFTLEMGLEIRAGISGPDDHPQINALYIRAANGKYLGKKFETLEECFAYIQISVNRLKLDINKKENRKKNVQSDEIFEAALTDEVDIRARQAAFKKFTNEVFASGDQNAIIAFNYWISNTPAEVSARECGRLKYLYDDLKAKKISLADLYAKHLGIARSTFFYRVRQGREALREIVSRVGADFGMDDSDD